ncbi:helix-turn-helix domain-containing protein [Methylobacterium sp. SI9]|uniref:helix-turn-helix domain-containing protein n=1 Tax=Methylobacterium guangdongense TaxID=3138811 RepID=UPI00313DA5FD
MSSPVPSVPDATLAGFLADVDAAQANLQACQGRLAAYLVHCGRIAPPGTEAGAWPASAAHPDLLTVAHAAARAGRHADTITRWCRERGIGKMYGKRWRVSVRRLDVLLKQNF